jgi:biopolymer transport protein ExbD
MQTAKQRRRSNQLISNINFVSFLASLVVLLYLLISPHRIGAHSFRPNVDLPQDNHPVEMPDLDRDDAIVISISRDGIVHSGNDGVDPSALPIKIQDRVKRGSPQVVYFWVDARARYLYVRKVLDAVRVSGVEKITFLVEKRKGNVQIEQ